jgi:hypothetical protein
MAPIFKCEICDRPLRGKPWLLRRDGYPWFVEYSPPMPPGSFSVFGPMTPEANAALTVWRIATCGSDVCVFRAVHHGVPGAWYGAGC